MLLHSEIIHTAPAPGLNLPDELQGYHTLVPLESTTGERRKFGNWYSTVYRATGKDGRSYVLRRVSGMPPCPHPAELYGMTHDKRLSFDASSCVPANRAVVTAPAPQYRLGAGSVHYPLIW